MLPLLLGGLIAPIAKKLFSNGLNLLGNAAINKGKNWVEDKTGVKLDENKELTNEELLKLKEFELNHEEELLKISLEQQKLMNLSEENILEDKQDARASQLKIVTSDNVPMFNKIFPHLLSLLTIISTFVLFAFVINNKVDPQVKDIVIYILGVLSSNCTSIYSYYFGSSDGSSKKNEMINNFLLNKNNPIDDVCEVISDTVTDKAIDQVKKVLKK